MENTTSTKTINDEIRGLEKTPNQGQSNAVGTSGDGASGRITKNVDPAGDKNRQPPAPPRGPTKEELVRKWMEIQDLESADTDLTNKIFAKLESMDKIFSTASNIQRTLRADHKASMSRMRRIIAHREKLSRKKKIFTTDLMASSLAPSFQVGPAKMTAKRKIDTSPTAAVGSANRRRRGRTAGKSPQGRGQSESGKSCQVQTGQPSAPGPESKWEVVRKNKKKPSDNKKNEPRTRVKPDAILVKAVEGGKSFAEVLK